MDLPGLEHQAVAATQAEARRRGTGPLGLVTSAVYRFSGRRSRVADPARHLREWRQRGWTGRPLEPIRDALVTATAAAPPRLRPVVAGLAAPDALTGRMANAIDRATC